MAPNALELTTTEVGMETTAHAPPPTPAPALVTTAAPAQSSIPPQETTQRKQQLQKKFVLSHNEMKICLLKQMFVHKPPGFLLEGKQGVNKVYSEVADALSAMEMFKKEGGITFVMCRWTSVFFVFFLVTS
jgi:hypothetical protein